MTMCMHLWSSRSQVPSNIRVTESVGKVRSTAYGSQRRHNFLVTSLLLLLLLTISPGIEGELDINVLSLIHNPEFPVGGARAFDNGFNASLSARNSQADIKVRVAFLSSTSSDMPVDELLEEIIEKSEDKLLLVLGPLGDDNIQGIKAVLKEHHIIAFSPIATSNFAFGWNPYLYYISVAPDAELMALVRYAFGGLGLRRLGAMYVNDTAFGQNSYNFITKLTTEMGHDIAGVFVVATGASDAEKDTEWEAEWNRFVESRPQAVVLLGPRTDDTRKFIVNMAKDNRTSRSYILAPSGIQSFVLELSQEVMSVAGSEFAPGQVFFSGTTPLASDNEFKMIRRFITEMGMYLGFKGERGVGAADQLVNDTTGEMMVLGWLTGEVISQALGNTRVQKNRTAFMESLYFQRRYIIDDVVIGDYGNECDEEAVRQGAVCRCNQGGSVVYMKEMVENSRLRPLPEGSVALGMSHCWKGALHLNGPLNAVVLLANDDEKLFSKNMEWYHGASASVADGRLTIQDRFFLHSLPIDFQDATHLMQKLLDVRVVSGVFGIVNEDLLEMTEVTFIDPITPVPRLNKFRENVIHLSPTVEQQVYVLAEYIYNNPSSHLMAIIRSTEAAEIQGVLRQTLLTFGVPLGSVVVVSDGDNVMDQLPDGGDVLIIGLTALEVNGIAAHLDEHKDVRVFVLFYELALFYDEFKTAFSLHLSASRLVFACSLPHWADVDATPGLVTEFHATTTTVDEWTPMSLLGFAAGRLMQTILVRMGNVSSELLADFFFHDSVIAVDDMWYGPYERDCVVDDTSVIHSCLSNYGATHISVWSMARALNPRVPVLQEATTPSMEYADLDSSLTLRTMVSVSTGLLLALALVIGVGVLLYYKLNSKRDNVDAPKISSDPVTLIFTDIESSTALWAAHPDRMPDAVASHHQLIRRLVKAHGCYEVKTVGDSFMIACRSALAAVDLIREIQISLLEYNWGTVLLDESYRDFEEAKQLECCNYIPHSANLDPEVYCQLWNGLRVRVGIHTGLCDIRLDDVTRGYDYYGQVPNMAARTESIANGGQVLLTEATYYSLSAAEREHIDVTPLGPVLLRGVPEPVEMYQLDAVPGRTFPPLRLDREYFFEEEEDMTSTSASDHNSSTVELSESAQHIVDSLQVVLRAFRPVQRERLLLPICERWQVSLPRKTKDFWDEEYSGEVTRRIAKKVGRVVDHQVHGGENRSRSTMSSGSVIFISNRCAAEDCAQHSSVAYSQNGRDTQNEGIQNLPMSPYVKHPEQG